MPTKWTRHIPIGWRIKGAEVKEDWHQRTFLGALCKAWLRLRNAGRPVPLSQVERVRVLVSNEAALVSARATNGSALRNPFLASRLSQQQLGIWSLGAKSLNFIERRIAELRPRLVLELGSGISTACLCQYMIEAHRERGRLYVISVDQDERFADSTAQLLRELGLSEAARVVSCALTEQQIAGRAAYCYDLSNAALVAALSESQPDFLLIDGPAADEGGRFGTLPLLSRYLAPGATFLMDDALRDGERATALLWTKLPYAQIDGIHLIEKGLLAGRILSGDR